MDKESQSTHSLNKYFQKLSLVFIFMTYTLTFWVTLYNVANLVMGLNIDFFYPTLKSGSLMVGSVLAFVICLYTSELFDTVNEKDVFTVEKTEDKK